MPTRLKTLQPNHTFARGDDAVFTNVRGLADLNGRLSRAPVRPDEPVGESFPFAPDNIRNAGLRRRGSRHMREQKIDQLPKAIDPRLALSRLVARAHQMRRDRPDKFAAQGAGARGEEHRRAPAVGFPKPPGAAAIFSIGQAGRSLDQHIRALGFAIVAVMIVRRARAAGGARSGANSAGLAKDINAGETRNTYICNNLVAVMSTAPR